MMKRHLVGCTPREASAIDILYQPVAKYGPQHKGEPHLPDSFCCAKCITQMRLISYALGLAQLLPACIKLILLV